MESDLPVEDAQARRRGVERHPAGLGHVGDPLRIGPVQRLREPGGHRPGIEAPEAAVNLVAVSFGLGPVVHAVHAALGRVDALVMRVVRRLVQHVRPHGPVPRDADAARSEHGIEVGAHDVCPIVVGRELLAPDRDGQAPGALLAQVHARPEQHRAFAGHEIPGPGLLRRQIVHDPGERHGAVLLAPGLYGRRPAASRIAEQEPAQVDPRVQREARLDRAPASVVQAGHHGQRCQFHSAPLLSAAERRLAIDSRAIRSISTEVSKASTEM